MSEPREIVADFRRHLHDAGRSIGDVWFVNGTHRGPTRLLSPHKTGMRTRLNWMEAVELA